MASRDHIVVLSTILLAAGLTVSSWPSLAAEQRSADDIINALKSPRATRGLSTSPADASRAADESQFLSAVRNRPTRSLSTEERDKIASIASSKPKIDLEINFEFNSAVIGSKAMPQVTELGKALTSSDSEGPHLYSCRLHGCQRQRNLQQRPLGASRRCCKAVPLREIRD